MSTNVIDTQELSVYYGQHRGIIDVDLQVHEGEVFGFLGPNGAGKTTTLRVLMDIIRPIRGRAMIFGMDCQEDGVKIRERVGYLPGELSLPPNLRGRQYLGMVNGLRDGPSDPEYQQELCARLDLDTSRRIRDYSHGNKQKLGLVAALTARSDLLVLDEPSSGLDPLVKKTVLEIVDEARQDGRTVLFSSHILSEVQEVCDRVGIIREGRLIKVESVETLTAQPFHRLLIHFGRMPDGEVFALDGVKELDRDLDSVYLEVQHNLPVVMERAASYEILGIETQPVTLEEVFLAYYGKNNRKNKSASRRSGGRDG